MIAVILPIEKSDYLANTVVDGLITLEADFRVTGNYPCPYDLKPYTVSRSDFIEYAKKAEHIFLIWGKGNTNYELAEEIGRWEVTLFIDGSEFGKNNRYTFTEEQKKEGIEKEMLKKCKYYFRREKPYVDGIIPLPFGIESRYIAPVQKKDIDFVCIFGQDEYPPLRRQAKEILEKFCKKNGFTCVTKKTSGFNFDDTTKRAGRDEFVGLLARAKVGISIGGGGFDTARFWEVLGNNCILLTETIDIDRTGLEYKRTHEFKDISDFEKLLAEIGTYLKTEYNQDTMATEYVEIVNTHSTKARVEKILSYANK